MEELKFCRACGKEKGILEFHKKSEYPDGRYPRCIECVKSKVYLPPPKLTDDEGLKKCSLCQESKTLEFFGKRNNRKNAYTARCRDCLAKTRVSNPEVTRNNSLIKMYGITSEEYNMILKSQGNCCGICKLHIDDYDCKRKKHFCVDHCHESNKIRGILCDKCNRGIGLLQDSTVVLGNAIKFLNKFKDK